MSNRFPRETTDLVAASALMGSLFVTDNGERMSRCIGAVDGTFNPICCLDGKNDLYRCRKGFYAINMQLMCDARCYIVWHNGGRPGRTWDGNGFAGTSLESDILPHLPPGFFIIADSSYKGTGRLFVPFKRAYKEDLNKKPCFFAHPLPRTRNRRECHWAVERSFPMDAQRCPLRLPSALRIFSLHRASC